MVGITDDFEVRKLISPKRRNFRCLACCCIQARLGTAKSHGIQVTQAVNRGCLFRALGGSNGYSPHAPCRASTTRPIAHMRVGIPGSLSSRRARSTTLSWHINPDSYGSPRSAKERQLWCKRSVLGEALRGSRPGCLLRRKLIDTGRSLCCRCLQRCRRSDRFGKKALGSVVDAVEDTSMLPTPVCDMRRLELV